MRELRSYKKLIPALEAFPDSAVVTADDVYYPPDWLTRLAAASQAHRRAILGFRCHMARTTAAGALLPYEPWE